MKQYSDMLQYVLDNGVEKSDRTGVGTLSVFGYQARYDLSKGFPLLTTKKTHFKSIVHELLWFLKGDTNVKYLQDNGVRIWNEWALPDGSLGRVYGAQWRTWQRPDGTTLDQIANVIQEIKTNPNSRRLLVVAYNPGELELMQLPPCHSMFQFFVANNKLSCQLYQRSADAFLGNPFNIASYALLTHMIAQVCGLQVGDFVHTIGDLHIYKNHLPQVKELLTRQEYPLPTLFLSPGITNIDDFKYGDIVLLNYQSHPAIKAEVAV